MLENKHFYHEHIRKAIIAFGSMFNSIVVKRKDDAGNLAQSIKVPLSYSTKSKMLSRVMSIPDLEENRGKVEITLPRMGFEITTLQYDTNRKLNTMQRVREKDAEGAERSAYVSTPYNIGVVLTVFSKNQDDGLQIIEQIMPYFNPDFNITVHEIPELNIKRDIQFILDSVNYSGEYEGAMAENVIITWELAFTIKINFFGYVSRTGIIRRVIENIYNNYKSLDIYDDIGTRITTEVDPFDAKPSDNFDFIQEFDTIYRGELE